MKTKYKILSIILVVLIVLQFFRPKKNISEPTPETDFISLTKPSTEIANLLKASCYDCHSNTTHYPWYNNISLVSYWLDSHIDEGKEHLNFSEWKNVSTDRKLHKLEEMREEIQERKMPLESYTWLHGDARLTDDQIFKVLEWTDKLTKSYELGER